MHFVNASWLYRLLGIDPSQIPRDAVSQLVFRNAPQSWRVFVFIGIVAALGGIIAYLYRREIDTCPPLAKIFLAGLRVAVVLLMVAIFLDPAVYYTEQRKLIPSIVLLRDASQSMGLTTDRYLDDDSARIVAAATGRSVEAVRSDRPTRAALVNEVLAKDNYRLLRELARRGNVRVVDFSNSVTEVPLRKAEPSKPPSLASGTPTASQPRPSVAPRAAFDLPSLEPTGQGTDLCRAIQEGLREKLVAAIVLFTDGQHTPKEPGERELLQLAEQARARDIPLLVVGVGDPVIPRNLSVSEVYADREVWPGDKFAVKAVLRAQGIADESVDVSLFERKLGEHGAADGPERRVTLPQNIPIPAGASKISVEFKPTAPEPGEYSYTVRAAVLPNESNVKDNQASVSGNVRVLGDQANVLLVSGEPSWEYLLLLRTLMRKKSFRLSSWLQTMDTDRDQEGTIDEKGSAVIRNLPRTLTELLNYQVVILLDPNPDEFDASWLQILKEYVGNHAGGLLYMAGPKYSGQFLGAERTRLIRDLLPVSFGDVKRLDVEQLLDTNSRQWKLDVVPAYADQPIMKLDPDASQSLARWAQLPGVYWSFPCDGVKSGKVLIERESDAATQPRGSRPLLVQGMYGTGRTVYVGFNGSWRWRRTPGNDRLYERFWLQTVRYLVEGRTVGGKLRSEIETDRSSYKIGDRIAITGRLKTPALEPLKVPRAVATLTESDNPPQQIELLQVANEPGKYAATLVARKSGNYTLSLKVPGEAANVAPESPTSFEVVLPDVELEKSWLNKPLLSGLAEVTKADGGRYFDLNELDLLPAQVPDRQQVTSVDSVQIPVRDSSRIPLVLLIVGLLTLEWAIRKRYKLI